MLVQDVIESVTRRRRYENDVSEHEGKNERKCKRVDKYNGAVWMYRTECGQPSTTDRRQDPAGKGFWNTTRGHVVCPLLRTENT